MPISADRIRQIGQRQRSLPVIGVQRLRKLGGQRQVVGRQLAFHAAVGGLAEQVQPRAAYPLHRRQHAKRHAHPRPERTLLQAALRVAAREGRRRQVVAHAIVAPGFAFKLRLQLGFEGGVGVQARHLVFVLVGH
ncbi:hypothetical protein G6F53_013912 [Rhizopus delemar]|nr:hypothetical protein G6F53_013912 [Rhizopus delemar]